MKKEFNCKGKRLYEYLINHGSKMIRKDIVEGSVVYVFEHDKSVDNNIKQFETLRKRCLF